MYGERVREVIDDSLALISNCFMMVAETFALSFLGTNELSNVYRSFRNMIVTRLNFEPAFLDERIATLMEAHQKSDTSEETAP